MGNSEKIKEELENKDGLDKNKVEIVDTDPKEEEDDQGVTPISPDIEDYSLLDRNKVDIIDNKNTLAEEAIKNLLQEENNSISFDQQGNEEAKLDPWLNKKYIGKP